MRPWLQYLIAFIVFCHGFIYVRIGSMLPAPVAGWNGSSWLLGQAVTGRDLVTLVVTLHVVAGILILASAFGIVLVPALPGWWRPLAVAGATAGIAAFLVFWDGQTALLVEEGAIGALVSVLLLSVAAAAPRVFD